MAKVDEIRLRTLQDAVEKLETYGKCIIIRPTGFGKTFMLTSIIRRYDSVLYLYPSAVIKNTVVNRYYDEEDSLDSETIETMKALDNIPNVTLMTYAKLARLIPEELESMNYDLIIFDECHRLGANLSQKAIFNLVKANPNSKMLGATATPNRADGFDVVSAFFSEVAVFEYTLHDAFQDGVLQVPYYCYCTYDIETDLKEAALMAGEDINDLKVKEVLKKKLVEISNIYNMENILKEKLELAHLTSSYMKFIVFFSNSARLHEKNSDIQKWFQTAFPQHTIRTLNISSNSSEKTNVGKLDSLTPCENVIDLIFCIDMLNVGYHVDNLTGVVMCRGTTSDIVYIQQLGRALSSGCTRPCIVFDVVDNLHRKAVFDVGAANFNTSKPVKTTWKCIDSRIYDSEGAELPYLVENGLVTDLQGNSTGMYVESSGEVFYMPSDSVKWIYECNKIHPEDLKAIGNEATYRELIAKVVAEPMTQRCKAAVEAHFRKWCALNNVKYPVSIEELTELYNLDKSEFTKYFVKIVKDNRLTYPINDAKKLLEIGKKSEDGIPMEIFAKWKNVSIPAILDLLGIVA